MSETIRTAWGDSALGDLLIAASDRGLVAVAFADRRDRALAALCHRFADARIMQDATGLARSVAVLRALVDHPEHDPGLPLDLRGTDAERRVWRALRAIPAGTTAHYGEIAARLGPPFDARGVGEACAANTLAILIPCHRIVRKDGGLSGYRWGIRRKRALLAREQQAVAFTLA